jgi:hypothetical protein
MFDIFISYRRGIGDSDFAGRVYDYLSGQFSVYFDKSETANPIGVEFPQRAFNAIRTCRVAIIIIGPQWVSQKSRLDDPRDWVALELGEIFHNEGTRIVPIYRGVYPEDLEAIPEPWHRLVNLNALFFDSFETSEKNTLLRQVETKLSRREGPVAYSAFNCAPLIVRCDRDTQQAALTTEWPTTAGKPRQVVTVLLSGFNDEDHNGFLERIRSQHVIERQFGLGPDATIQIHTAISVPALCDADYHGLILEVLKQRLINCYTAHLEQVQRYLFALKKALIVTVFITDEDLNRVGRSRTSTNFREAFLVRMRSLFGASAAPVLMREVALGFATAWDAICGQNVNNTGGESNIAKPPMVLWLNLAYLRGGDRAHSGAAPHAEGIIALPELAPVTRNDIVKWINDPDVHRYAGAGPIRTVLENLADAADVRPGKGRIHMRLFRDKVEELLFDRERRSS